MRLPRVTRASLRRVGVRALVALLGSYVGYVVVINVLLSTGLAKQILNGLAPDHVTFDYASAYSLWFANVHTTGFSVRGTDSAVEWKLTTDEAATTFGVTDFFDRRVHMYGAVAKGVTFRMRFKVTAPTAAYLAELPPIEGFPDPPISPPPLPELTDENYDLWSVALDDVSATDVREVWVDTVRFTDAGGGSVVGAFYFKPLRRVRVDPSEYTAVLGEVDVGATAIATDIHGAFALGIAELDPRVPSGHEAFSYFDAKAVAVAKLGDLAWVDAIVGPRVALTGGGGPVEISAALRRGVLEPGSRLDVRSESWRAWLGRDWLSGTSLVHARVTKKDPPVALVAVESYGVDVHHDTTPVATAPVLGVVTTFANTDLAAPFRVWTVHVDAPSARVPDLKAINAYLGQGAFLYGGSARVSVHGDADSAGASGKVQATLSNVSMQAARAMVTGNGTVDLTLRRFDLESSEADFALARFGFHEIATGKQRGYWVDASVSPLKLSLAGGATVRGSISGKARDAQLPLAVLDAPSIVRSLVGGQSFTFSSQLRASPSTLDLTDVRAFGDTIDVHAHYRSDGLGKNGAALVSTPLVNVGIELRRGDVSVRPLASQGWYTQTGG